MTDPPAPPIRPRAPRGADRVLIAGAYLAYFDRALPSAGGALLKRELALSDTALALGIATLFAVAYATTSLALAAWPHAPLKRLAMLGVATWATGSALLAFVTRFAGLAAAETLCGIGQAAFVPAALSLIANGRRPDRIGRATARFTVATGFGRMSGLLIAGLLIAALGAHAWQVPWLPARWRLLFLVTLAPNLVVLAGLMRTAGPGADAAPVAAPLRDPHRLTVGRFVCAVAPAMVIQAIGLWFPVLLVADHGLTAARAAMLTGGVLLVAAAAGQLIGGWLIDRLGAGPAAGRIVTVALAAAALAMPLLLLPGGVAGALTVLAVTEVALGIAALAALAGVQAAAGAALRGRANSLFFALVTLVSLGLGPLLAGMAMDRAVGRAAALCLVAAIGVALAATGRLLDARARRYRVAKPGPA